jgi:hypothetical protein
MLGTGGRAVLLVECRAIASVILNPKNEVRRGGDQGKKLVFGSLRPAWVWSLRLTAIFNLEGGICSNVGLKQGFRESSWDNR